VLAAFIIRVIATLNEIQRSGTKVADMILKLELGQL
jgi:hypothetical protein